MDITVEILHEVGDYFHMKVTQDELKVIQRFTSEINESSTVSIKLYDMNGERL